MSNVVLVQEEPRGPSQLVEVPVTLSGQSRIKFPDIQQLRSQVDQKVIIKAMRLITLEILTGAITLGLPNAPVTELQKIALLIYSEGWEKGQYIPILTLCDTSTPGGTFPHRYHQTRFANWQNVDWTKTYLIYANGTSSDVGETDGYSVLLDVEYERYDSTGNILTGAQ